MSLRSILWSGVFWSGVLSSGVLVAGRPAEVAPAALSSGPAAGARARSAQDTRALERAALLRSAAALPRAALGQWEGWQRAPLPPLYQAALQAYRRDDLAATWRLALECLDGAPDHPPSLSLLGGVAFRLKRHEDAVVAFERFLAHAPEEAARTRHLGHAYHGLGRYAEARAHYARVLAAPGLRDDAAREARFGLALSAYRAGDHAAAEDALAATLALAPDDVEALTWRAQLCFEDERLADARAAAERALALAPYEPRPWYLLARTLAEELAALPEAAEARAALAERAAEAERRFGFLAVVETRTRDLEATLALAAGDSAARSALARLRADVGDAQGALRQAALLARTARGERAAELTVLDVLERCGNPTTAAAVAERLERDFDNDAEVLDAVSAFHARRGDIQGQLRTGARAAQLRAQR